MFYQFYQFIFKTNNKILYFDPTIQFIYLIEKYRVLILDIYKVCILMIISYFNIIWLFGSLEKIFLCVYSNFFIIFCLHCFFIFIDYYNYYYIIFHIIKILIHKKLYVIYNILIYYVYII